MKCSFFQAAVVLILLYGCTTWTLTKRLEKKLDGNYTRMLRAILNKSWRQQLTKHQLYGHLSPITKTIQVRRTRLAGPEPHHHKQFNDIPRALYIYIYIYKDGCCRFKKRIRIKIGRSTKIYLFCSYIRVKYIFPACCFRHKAQGFFNGVLNDTWTHSCFQYKWLLSGQIGLYRGPCSSFLECVLFWSASPVFNIWYVYHIYPTPPLGQDMTQGQFFKRSLTGLNSEFSFS